MVRAASVLAICVALAPLPASAREGPPIDVPATRLDQAVGILGRQAGVSIGFRDPAIAALKVRAVRGSMSAGEALERMLRQTRMRARRVAPDAFLVEAAPVPLARPVPAARTERTAPPTAITPPPPAPPVEIVVTGSKRDVPLDAYPGMVHIIDGEQITFADGRKGTGAIEDRVASVLSTHLGPGRNKLFIRGIADSSFIGPTQATVGQYWGNSRITYSAPDPSLKLYDVSRIEVLEGPQGTLYGAGSLGGVVRVVPREPDLDTVGGAVWAGAEMVQHGDPGVDGGAVINLPLVTDRLGFRAVGFGSVEGGYIDDTGRGRKDVNTVRTWGGRAALRYAEPSGWIMDLSAVGQRIHGEDSQYAERGRGLTRSTAAAQPYNNDFLLTDVVIRKRWDDLEFTSSFGYAYQDVFERFEGPELADAKDSAISPSLDARTASYSQANRINMFTAETRLARAGPEGAGWIIAASLLRNEARVRREMDMTFIDSALTGVRNKVEEATLYGEGTVQPIPRITVTLGGRLTHSRLSGQPEDVAPSFALKLDPMAAASRSETRFLPSLALAWRANDRITAFARIQQGFRPGGIAVRREFVQRYRGDRVTMAEAGMRFRSREIDLEMSASWTDWRDIQADLIDGYGFPTTANIGDGRVLSVGLSSRWRPINGLELDAALYFNRSRVMDHTLTPTVTEILAANPAMPLDVLPEGGSVIAINAARNPTVTSVNRLPNIAGTTARMGFTWSRPVSDTLDFQMSGFARYVGKSILGIGPILGQLQGDYFDTGLEAGFGSANTRFTVSLSNLLDSRGNRFALGSPFLVRDRNQITPLKPRSIRIGVQFGF